MSDTYITMENGMWSIVSSMVSYDDGVCVCASSWVQNLTQAGTYVVFITCHIGKCLYTHMQAYVGMPVPVYLACEM